MARCGAVNGLVHLCLGAGEAKLLKDDTSVVLVDEHGRKCLCDRNLGGVVGASAKGAGNMLAGQLRAGASNDFRRLLLG